MCSLGEEEEITYKDLWNRAKGKIFEVLYTSQGLTPPSSPLPDRSLPVSMNEEQYKQLFDFLEEEVPDVKCVA